MANRDLASNLGPAVTIAPAANRTATTTGGTVDLRGFDAAMVLAQFGVVTDGTWTPSVEESDDDSTFTAVASTDLVGAFTAVTSASGGTVQKVSYVGDARYIRLIITETVASSTGALFNGLIVRGEPSQRPVA